MFYSAARSLPSLSKPSKKDTEQKEEGLKWGFTVKGVMDVTHKVYYSFQYSIWNHFVMCHVYGKTLLKSKKGY